MYLAMFYIYLQLEKEESLEDLKKQFLLYFESSFLAPFLKKTEQNSWAFESFFYALSTETDQNIFS